MQHACVFTQTFECKLPANSSVCWHTTSTADENSECQLQCLQGHILLHYTKNNSCSVLTTIKQYTTKKSLPEKHEYSHTDENNANNSLQLAAVHCTQCIIDWLTQHYTHSTKQAQWGFHTAWCLSAFLFIFYQMQQTNKWVRLNNVKMCNDVTWRDVSGEFDKNNTECHKCPVTWNNTHYTWT